MSPCRADDPSLGVTRNSTSPLPWPEAGDNPEIQFTALDTVQPHSGCVAIDKLATPPSASTTDGLASDTPHLTAPGPVPVTVVVEDALQPAVAAAATSTTATSRDGRRLTQTMFDAGLSIMADSSYAGQSRGPRSRRARAIPLKSDLVQRRSAPAITATRSNGDLSSAACEIFINVRARSAREDAATRSLRRGLRLRTTYPFRHASGRAPNRRAKLRDRCHRRRRTLRRNTPLTASRSPPSSRRCSHRRRDFAQRRRSLHLR
jgi:hypothetical protein